LTPHMQDEEHAQANNTDDEQIQLNCAFHHLESRVNSSGYTSNMRIRVARSEVERTAAEGLTSEKRSYASTKCTACILLNRSVFLAKSDCSNGLSREYTRIQGFVARKLKRIVAASECGDSMHRSRDQVVYNRESDHNGTNYASGSGHPFFRRSDGRVGFP
jgi:hypothetical protein